MKCMLCGEELDEHGLCPGCFARSSANPAEEDQPKPKKRKKARIWPGILCLVLIFAIGLGVFLVLRPAIDPTMPWFSLVNGMLSFNQSLYVGGEELTIPDAIAGKPVTAIAPGGFAYMEGISYVELPDSVTALGDGAFVYCTGLRGVKLPEGLRTMGSDVFYGCEDLEAVTIPLSLKAIGSQCFAGCDSLQFLFYPGTIKQFQSIGMDRLPEKTQIRCSDGVFQQQKN